MIFSVRLICSVDLLQVSFVILFGLSRSAMSCASGASKASRMDFSFGFLLDRNVLQNRHCVSSFHHIERLRTKTISLPKVDISPKIDFLLFCGAFSRQDITSNTSEARPLPIIIPLIIHEQPTFTGLTSSPFRSLRSLQFRVTE